MTASPFKRALLPAGKDTSVAPFSPGIACGDLVFVSGQGPLDPERMEFVLGSIEEETRRTLENVQRVLKAAHCDMDDVVKVNVHLRYIEDFTRFNAVYETFFAPPYPARTTVASGLGAGISVEIEAIAVRRTHFRTSP